MSATEREVEDECKRHIDLMGKGGGFILATGCEYPCNLGDHHARTMVRVAKEYRL
jgi:uroporphyrinogen decarboxylase